MPQLSDRVGTFTDSVIRRMTRINNQYDSINLSQGFPDFDPPKQLLNEAIRRLEKLSRSACLSTVTEKPCGFSKREATGLFVSFSV